MRTSMTNWFKFPLALLMCSMLASVSNAQDATSATAPDETVETTPVETVETAKDEKVKTTRTKEERAALKFAKAEKIRTGRFYKTQTPVDGYQPVDMYDGIASGEVEVIIKAKSSSDSNFFVKNLTDKPLAIKMPEVFSAVPALRQFGGGGGQFGGGGRQGGFGGGAQQGIGGGFGGGGGGGQFRWRRIQRACW